MANVGLSMKRARKRSKEEKAESKQRFKDILAIVKKYELAFAIGVAVNVISRRAMPVKAIGQKSWEG